MVSVLFCIIYLFFFAFCYYYSTQIHLWGDEVISILRAQSFWLDIVKENESHLPTYFLVLKILFKLINPQYELLLRMIHCIPFVIGLWFGTKIIGKIFKNVNLTLLTLVNAIILPNFIFYATNLRMYSLIFMFSMMYINLVVTLIQKQGEMNYIEKISIFCLASCLIMIDYGGLIYFVLVLLFLLINKYYQIVLLNLFPCLLFLLWIILFGFGDIKAILDWPVALSQGINLKLNEPILLTFLQTFYLSLRPGLDLIYAASLPMIIAIIFPIILVVVYLLSSVDLLLKSQDKPELKLIIFLSGAWLFLGFTGYGFTRLFLPSQFFMLGIINQNIFKENKINKIIISLLIGILLIINLHQAIQPTLRLYSLIDYREIALDLKQNLQNNHVKNIVFSNNSLNNESIKYYLKQEINQKEVNLLDFTNALNLNSLLPLIFVSHMAETDNYVNINLLNKQLNQNGKLIGKYVKLQNLPYYHLWKKRILDRTNQPYAIENYLYK